MYQVYGLISTALYAAVAITIGLIALREVGKNGTLYRAVLWLFGVLDILLGIAWFVGSVFLGLATK